MSAMMTDRPETAELRGFDASVDDIGDQLHLRHPLLRFEHDDKLYVARRFNWRHDQRALAIADPTDARALATLLPATPKRRIECGEGVVVAGQAFVQAAAMVDIELSALGYESDCWVGTATPERFADLQARLARRAKRVFDQSLGVAAGSRCRLCERGHAALLILHGCGAQSREDLAIRELAGAWQDGDFDLYRRLLDGFEIELEVERARLHMQAAQHIELTAGQYTSLGEPVPASDEQGKTLESDRANGQAKVNPHITIVAMLAEHETQPTEAMGAS